MREKKELVLHIRVDETLKAELEALAIADERKLSPFVTRILRAYVAQEKAVGRMPEFPAEKRAKGRKP
jgi:hypothetical protein